MIYIMRNDLYISGSCSYLGSSSSPSSSSFWKSCSDFQDRMNYGFLYSSFKSVFFPVFINHEHYASLCPVSSDLACLCMLEPPVSLNLY